MLTTAPSGSALVTPSRPAYLPQMNDQTFGFTKEDPLLQWMKAVLENNEMINSDDLELVTVTEDVQEAIDLMVDSRRRISIPGHHPEPRA
jgi:predicted Rossmann-fold nucleotide-binding protein